MDFNQIWEQIKGAFGSIGDVFGQIQPYLAQVGDFLKKSPPLFVAFIMFLTVLFDPSAQSTDTSVLVREDVYVLMEALTMGQGITNDGEYYYTSGAITALKQTALAKYDMKTMKQVAKADNPLPSELTNLGCDHIGGISYYNGKIYASVEDSKNYEHPHIVVFDAATLKYEKHYNLHPKDQGEGHNEDPLGNFVTRYPDGVPWCAVNPETGILYASYWSHAKVIYKYDIDSTMAYMGAIELTGIGELDRIQGGEFYEGKLYLSQDNSGRIKNVLKVNVNTGNVSLAFTRDVGGDKIEAEDLTVFLDSDGALFHVLDYNSLIGVYMRHYDVSF
ncbi:MAG: hypothetical protein FWF05_03000 [Oscillospiraceae bacterium]|nr:hypothetical protein [Oscillospiraceae bacterium]